MPISRPKISIFPASFGWKADKVRNNVDFPTPFAPSRQVSSPPLIAVQIPLATTFVSFFPLYPIDKSFNRIVTRSSPESKIIIS